MVLEVVGGVTLAVLAFSGGLKGNAFMSWLPLDLTIASVLIVVLCVFFRAVRDVMNSDISLNSILPLSLWIVFLFPVMGMMDTDFSNEKVRILFSVTLLCAVAPTGIFRSRVAQIAFLAGLFLISLLSAGGTAFGSDNYADDYSNRLTLEGSTTIMTAQMVSAGGLLAFLGAFSPLPKKWRIASLLLAPVLLYVSILTGSRGPVVSVVISIVAIVLVAKSLRKYRVQGILGAVAVIGLGVYQAMQSGSDGVGRILTFVSGDDAAGGSGRSYIYSLALETSLENPFGIGWGSFLKFGHGYPHNILLEILVEGGVLVFIIVVILLMTAVLRLYRRSEGMLATAFLSILFVAFINAMFSSDINGNKLLWIALFAAFVIARDEDSSISGPDRDTSGDMRAPVGMTSTSPTPHWSPGPAH
ncbi:O-antigen ligase family protein [Citricoccus sp. NPDC079358]|uniref:O-antigen ligase family protein n=1 Tax=Citricoccus sp. NPDC079358 TaxID=3154653 RepID=UPI00344CD841